MPPKKGPKAKAKSKAADKTAEELIAGGGDAALTKEQERVASRRAVTGVLATPASSLDVKFEAFSVQVGGHQLITDCDMELNMGCRYGLIGDNGSGKSNVLAAIAQRDLPLPEHIDVFHLHEEAPPSDQSAVEAVMAHLVEESARLEALMQKIMEESGPEDERVGAIMERIDELDPTGEEPRARKILSGLGFADRLVPMDRKTKDMSGGWRMRVSLAKALFARPSLLLLDEPTNHLDLGACVWLEEYLARYPNTLLFTSHSEDFMNGVCTNIMQLTQKGTLVNWGGNYAQYMKTRTEFEKNQLTKWKKEQDDIKHLQDFIRSCGTYANLRIQAESKQKIIDKMVDAGLTEKPVPDPTYHFAFPDSEKISPPVLAFNDVSFSYSGKKEDHLYENLELGVDLDSRIALVGPNGAGKSTLLKLMLQQIEPTVGEVKRSGKLRIGHYNQHSEAVLDLDMTPLAFLQKLYPEGVVTTSGMKKLEEPEWRGKLGSFGITGDFQTRKMKTMSDGMRTRVVMLLISLVNPHVLLLDEPTNHLDMQCIDALAQAINKFSGGLVLVSHDFRLIGQVAKEIWVCDKKSVTKWEGDIQSYKAHLKKQVMKRFKA
mmetsp:Transcript_7939/g.25262  ORF Transcript_7939/g.25262 Transcript_7939/m.25262 type:complete len:602 (+) Transcript_7939:69-1874(+)